MGARVAILPSLSDGPPCGLCGHKRDGVDLGAIEPFFVCDSCTGALSRWLSALSEETVARIWTHGVHTLREWSQLRTDPPAEEADSAPDAVFTEFKAGLEKLIGPDDAQTHLDLGIAYREMEMPRDALVEWSLVLRSGAPRAAKRQALMLVFDPSHLQPGALELLRGGLFPN